MVFSIIVLGGMILSALLAENDFDEIKNGLELSYRCRYEEASQEFDRLIEKDQENPLGYLLKAALLETKMVDFANLEGEKEFYSLLEEVESKAMRILKENPEDPWAHYYLGAQYSYKSVHQLANRSFWTGFRNGLRARREFQKAVKSDPSLYDAYLGLGIFHWATSKAFSWIPFLGDNRQKGIREVELAMEKGYLSQVAAKSVLVWIHLLDHRFENALKWAEELLESYPENRFFWISLATIYYEKGDWVKVEETYKKLLTLVLDNPPCSYHRILSHAGLAEAYYHLGSYELSLKESELALLYGNEPPPHPRLKEILDKVKSIQKKVRKRMRRG